MKTTCTFCKTEYTLDAVPCAPLRCVLCGNIWNAAPVRPRSSFMVIMAAVCALLAVVIFTVVIISRDVGISKNAPLTAKISEITTVIDAFGVPHFKVYGTILNNSDEIYGVPDLLIISLDGDGNIISRQRFMPSSTLLDAGAHADFTHTLSADTNNVKKLTVKLYSEDETTGKK